MARAPHPHFVGDTSRPIVTLPMSPGRHRWEWMLHPGEDQAPFLEPGAHPRAARAVDHGRGGRGRARRRLHLPRPHRRALARRARAARRRRRARDAAVRRPGLLLGRARRRQPGLEARRRPARRARAPARHLRGRAPPTRHEHAEARRALGRRRPDDEPARRAAARPHDRGRSTAAASLDWLQQRAKPLPTYGAGAFASRPHPLPFRRAVGSLFPQPDRLDDRLGFRLGGRREHARRGERVARRADCAWSSWLHERAWTLLRPDRYVFACGGSDELPPALAALRRTVGAGLVSEAREAVAA